MHAIHFFMDNYSIDVYGRIIPEQTQILQWVVRYALFIFFKLASSNVCQSYFNKCNKSVSCRNLMECSLCLTKIHLKCSNLNVVDTELLKNCLR